MPRNSTPDYLDMPPVIFLDFDGVLKENGKWSAEAVAQLNELCMESGASIVLTTSERYSHSPKTLHQILAKHRLDSSIVVLGETRDLSAYRRAARQND